VSRPPAGPVSQLAAAAGYDVITTASPHNADYVRGLGASQVFDYRSPTAVADLTQALRGCTLAGTIGTGSAEACLDVVHAATGSKVIATASTAVSFEHLADTPRADPAPDRADQPDAARHRRAAAAIPQTGHPRTTAIWGSTLKDNEVGPAFYVDYLPQAHPTTATLQHPSPTSSAPDSTTCRTPSPHTSAASPPARSLSCSDPRASTPHPTASPCRDRGAADHAAEVVRGASA